METSNGGLIEVNPDGSLSYTSSQDIEVNFTPDDEGNVNIEGIVENDGTVTDVKAPIVQVTSSTTNSISFTAIDSIGVVAYAVTENATTDETTEWTTVDKKKKVEITATGLAENKTYYIWAKDGSGNISAEKTGKTIDFEGFDYDVTWSGDKNATATITVKTPSSGVYYIITPEEGWQTYTTPIQVASGTSVTFKVTDGTNTKEFDIVEPKREGTITYNANTGTGSVPSQTTSKHKDNVSVDFSTLPSKTGYTFNGWSTNASASSAEYTSGGTETFTMPAEDVVLYAVWQINNYTVTIARNNTSYGTVSSASVSIPHGTTYSASGATLSFSNGTKVTASVTNASGYTTTFSNWSPESGTITGAITITANFARELIEGPLSATGIAQGDYIDLGNDPLGTGNTATNWRVLKVESSYVYAILADYLPNAPSGTNITIDGYRVYANKNRTDLINYLTNTSIWSKFTNGISGASCVGAVTKDFMSGCGFVDGSETRSLFVPHTSSWNSTFGYWLASPFGSDPASVWYVRYNGLFSILGYNLASCGVRPAVTLPSSILAKKVNNVWKVK